MSGRKRKGKTEVAGHDLTDEVATVLINLEDSLPQTKLLLSTKPHLSADKRENIEESLKELRVFVTSMAENMFDKEEQAKHTKDMFAITTFLKTILDFEDYSYLDNFRAIIHSAVSLIVDHPSNNVDAKLKNHIALLSLRFMEMVDFDEIDQFIGSVTLCYFLGVTLSNIEGEKNVRKVDIKHVWSMHKFLDVINLLDPIRKELLDKLMSTVSNENYIKLKEGHNVIGHLMSRNVIFAKKIHQIIIDVAPNLSKNVASGYGDAYFIGWSLAKEEVREEIENSIQDLVLKVIKVSRSGFEMTRAGSSGLAILSTLHQSRRLKNFSNTLNKLYTPVIWRYLKSSDPWERCNTVQVFLDVFPLEKPFLSEPDNAMYMDRQIKEIRDILLDDSHFVRIIGIKGICAHLTNSLQLFSLVNVKAILKVIGEELVNDGSSYLVRKAVFEGLEMMINGPPGTTPQIESESASVLEPLLPLMYLSIHDENEKVRKAFVKMLLKIKEKSKVMKLKYWEVVPLKHLAVRLSNEGPVVGEMIVKLIMNEFYVTGQDTDKTINRLIRLMSWSAASIKNLFHYSKNVLTVDQAFMIIITLVGMIRKKLRDFLDLQSEIENEHKKEATTRKKKRKGSLEDISNKTKEKDKSIESETSPSPSSPPARSPYEINAEFLENHRFIAGLINGATVLWVTFRNEISENEKYIDNLYSLACNAIPLFLKHYKGTCVYYATVSFASLIPISKLKGVSTVSSACISELKEITDDTDVSKIECLIYSLCSWFRGHDVLDLASEWLNYAFREQDLNNSAMPVKAGQRAAKVRFLQTEGKPMLSLKLLEILFSDVLNESRLVSKNYEQLYEFYICLERILVIIERKVAGEDFKPDTKLTDEFLFRAFMLYLRMMHALHRPELPPEVTDSVPAFNIAATTVQTINWASNMLYKHIPTYGGSGNPPLAASCCQAVLKYAGLAIALGITDETHCKSVALFASDLLSFDCFWFIEEVIQTIKYLSDYAQDDTPNDEWQLIKNIIPCLLEKSLNVISNLEVPVGSAKKYFNDLFAMKQALFTFPKTILSMYGVKDPQFVDTLRMYINTCINIVMQEINKEDDLIKCKKLDEQPYFVTFILKYILVIPSFVKQLLPSFLYYSELFKEAGYKLLSCISLLYTIILSARGRFDASELEETVQEIYQILKQYKDKENIRPLDLDKSTFTSSSINIDVKTVGEPLFEELSKYLQCSLQKPLIAPKIRVACSPIAPVTPKRISIAANSLSDLRATPAPELCATPQDKANSTSEGIFLVPSLPPPSETPKTKFSCSKNRSSKSLSRLISTPPTKVTPTSLSKVRSASKLISTSSNSKLRSAPKSISSYSKENSPDSSKTSPTVLSESFLSIPDSQSCFTPSPAQSKSNSVSSSRSDSNITPSSKLSSTPTPQSHLTALTESFSSIPDPQSCFTPSPAQSKSNSVSSSRTSLSSRSDSNITPSSKLSSTPTSQSHLTALTESFSSIPDSQSCFTPSPAQSKSNSVSSLRSSSSSESDSVSTLI